MAITQRSVLAFFVQTQNSEVMARPEALIFFGVNKEFSGYGMARGTDFFASKEFSCNGEAQFLVLPTNDFMGSEDNLLPCDLGRFLS